MEADKMFEELGYTKNEDLYRITYTNIINPEEKIIFSKIGREVVGLYYEKYPIPFKASVIQAINEKYKELGWI